MKSSEQVNFWNARFVSRGLEVAFQRNTFARTLRSNVGGVCLGLLLYIAFVFTDYIESVNPGDTIRVKLMFFTLSVVMLATLRLARFREHQDFIIAAIVTLLGVSMNYVILQQPTLENNYYIGLVQGNILFAILLRLNFPSMSFVLLSTLFGFIFVASTKGQPQLAILQSANLGLVCLICMAGAYILQRYQRTDFLKTRMIETQNEQLKGLLKVAEKDNERKIAALNMLVHFVKTPLHQITGFSDILVSSTDNSSSGEAAENARYIKNATVNLTKSVNGLLAYHRLDEAESSAEFCDLPLSSIVNDFSELLPGNVEPVRTTTASENLFADEEILRAALQGFADHYADEKNGATRVTIGADATDEGFEISIRDDGRIITTAQFEELIQPITEMEGYLGHAGEQMPMALRTAARALEILGGKMRHIALADGNRYVLSLPTVLDAAAARQTIKTAVA